MLRIRLEHSNPQGMMKELEEPNLQGLIVISERPEHLPRCGMQFNELGRWATEASGQHHFCHAAKPLKMLIS